ncbi:MAG: hypothetical protein QE271_08835 [Bacteriovoracaceae bacterium]|nr:hypothetical protein [Bacteriovoracaceae bacterium]
MKNQIQLIKKINKELGDELSKRFFRFYKETKLLARKDIEELNDANYAPIDEENCYVRQFAVQYANTPHYEKRYKIDKQLFEHTSTSNDTKAGLILHELILGIALDHFAATSSDSIRPLNYVLSTDLNKTFEEDNATLLQDSMKNLLTNMSIKKIENELINSPIRCHSDIAKSDCNAFRFEIKKILKKIGFDLPTHIKPIGDNYSEFKINVFNRSSKSDQEGINNWIGGKNNSKKIYSLFRGIQIFLEDDNLENRLRNLVGPLTNQTEFAELATIMARVAKLTNLSLICSDGLFLNLPKPEVKIAKLCKDDLLILEQEYLASPYKFKKVKELNLSINSTTFLNIESFHTQYGSKIYEKIMKYDSILDRRN